MAANSIFEVAETSEPSIKLQNILAPHAIAIMLRGRGFSH